MPVKTKYVPGIEVKQLDRITVTRVNGSYYRDRVPRGYAWDLTYETRFAAAAAKDRARLNLIRAIEAEEARLQHESLTSLSGLLAQRDFSDQAARNVLAKRAVDGVDGASDDDILL
ncbi:hypothetical protein OZ411_01300 [Bradyrhizobium sp. Arg237L]|uniref:hypothetical protein n=1 Tax=Bradyrhizobium sp. Arg237L TaxID=3003352 RepID=UPI00249E0B73|nr:hypothetical protein [Bradyrhizobium sp. Arg237L]MDI4231449.1 hypothetical protein [Bradyrhizobium sp. Arg237L]